MNLADLQQTMREWLETGDPKYAQFGEAGQPGLEIYLNNYRVQLMRCLDTAFPCMKVWLGGESFRAAARRHIITQPPTTWTLDAYPGSFAANVDTLFPHDRVTHEIARLEQALADVETAADLSPLTRDMLVDLDWEHVMLTYPSGAQVLRNYSNAVEIYSAVSRGENPPAANTLDAPVNILIWRSDWVPCFRVLDPDEAEIFTLMAQPLPFTDICMLLQKKLGARAAVKRAGLLLARWADDKAVSFETGS